GRGVSNHKIFKPFEGNGFPLSALGEFPQTVSNSARQRYLTLVDGASSSTSSVLARFGLQLASVPYGLAIRLRTSLYTLGWLVTQRAAAPVVSVGNLTVGGTGKTPCVEYVAGFYRCHDRRVAVLSRGYGSAGGRNDEALVLEENLPDVP